LTNETRYQKNLKRRPTRNLKAFQQRRFPEFLRLLVPKIETSSAKLVQKQLSTKKLEKLEILFRETIFKKDFFRLLSPNDVF